MEKHRLTDKLILISEVTTYLILIAALVFLSTFYRTGLFVFLLILVIALPIASYLVGRYTIGKLSASLAAPTDYSQLGSNCTVSVKLSNTSFFPLPDCHIRYRVTSSFYPCDKSWLAVVPAYSKGTFSFDLPFAFQRIGCYRFTLESLTVYDYLHLFSYHKKAEDTLELRIYPPEEECDTNVTDAYGEGFDEFEETAAKGIHSSNVTDVREYFPGDRLQQIHWKLSAKIDKLMVKENESSSSNQFTILTELYLPTPDSDFLDTSLSSTYTLSRSLLAAGQVHFLSFFCMGSTTFITNLITNKEQLDQAFLEAMYQTPYPEEDLALTTYLRAGMGGGVLLHVSHKGVTDVVS